MTGRVGEESGEAGAGTAGGLVGVGGDVAPAGLAGHLTDKVLHLVIEANPASSTSDLVGVDGDSPHGGSFLVQHVRA